MRRYLRYVLLAGFSLIIVPCHAEPPQSPLSPAAVEAVDTLRTIPEAGIRDIFALGGIGAGGHLPAKLQAAQAVLLRPDASHVFTSLLSYPSTATQMYALAGLRLTDPAAFNRAFVPFNKRRDTVFCMSGCIGFQETVGDTVRKLRNGQICLHIPSNGTHNPAINPAVAPAFLLGNVVDGHVFSLCAPSYEFVAFNVIKERKDAVAVFRSLLYSSDSATQLYGLAGLAQRAPDQFRQVAQSYLSRRNAVQFKDGTTEYVRPLGDCVRDLLAGRAPYPR